MGKGDQKTRRGKLFSGSFGVRRPRKRKRSLSLVTTTKKAVAPEKKDPLPKKPVEKKTEIVAEKAVEAAIGQVEATPVAEEITEAAPEKAKKTKEPTPVVEKKKPATKKPAAKKPKAEKTEPIEDSKKEGDTEEKE